MSENKLIDSGDGDFIRAYSNGSYVVVAIIDVTIHAAEIWLTPEQADEHIRQVAAARVELSNARPQS